MNRSRIISATLFAVFTFFISCSDDDDTSPSTNNSNPVIKNQEFSIPNNASIGTSVGIVSASGEDDDALTFTITSGNEGNIFSIDDRGILYMMWTYDPVNGALRTGISSGDINLFENEALKAKLFAWEDLANDIWLVFPMIVPMVYFQKDF